MVFSMHWFSSKLLRSAIFFQNFILLPELLTFCLLAGTTIYKHYSSRIQPRYQILFYMEVSVVSLLIWCFKVSQTFLFLLFFLNSCIVAFNNNFLVTNGNGYHKVYYSLFFQFFSKLSFFGFLKVYDKFFEFCVTYIRTAFE